jgi:putative N6-adenine-specific DNA methylase
MKIVAKTMAGLETVLAEELKNIGASKIQIVNRAVEYQGDLEVLYRSNLELRTALRILHPVTVFSATNEHQLYEGISHLYWDKYITKGKTIAVNAAIHSQHFNHSHYVALKTKDAIVDQLRNRWGTRPDVDVDNADIRINTHIHQDKVTVSLDSSGHSLHKRGYRIASVEAPINEVLAAGLILLSEWDKKTNFYDPMCGSGSFISEAALMAMNKPPQPYNKEFSFFHWKDFDRLMWSQVVEKAMANEKALDIEIKGFDIDRKSVNASKFNLAEAGLKDLVTVELCDFFENTKFPVGAHVIFNPPYDIRLKQDNIVDFFKQIGDQMKKNMPGTTVWIISSNIPALKMLGLKPSKKISLFNGPNPAKFHKFEIYEGSRKKT